MGTRVGAGEPEPRGRRTRCATPAAVPPGGGSASRPPRRRLPVAGGVELSPRQERSAARRLSSTGGAAAAHSIAKCSAGYFGGSRIRLCTRTPVAMRSSQGAIQPPPDSRKPTRSLGWLLAHTAPDHAHASEHHLHRVRDDVLRPATLEPVDTDRRHAAVAALVDADHEIELLGRVPQRLVVGIVQHPVVVWIGPHKPAAEPERRAKRISAIAWSTDCIGSIAMPNRRSG